MLKIEKIESWKKEKSSRKTNFFGAVAHFTQGIEFLRQIPEKGTKNRQSQ